MKRAVLAVLLAFAPAAAQDPAPSAPAQPSAAMGEVRHRLGLVATRAIANFRSMDSIEQNLEDMGLTLNAELIELRSRIEAALDETDEAIGHQDAKAANEALDQAEALLGKLAKRIGGD